MNFASRRKKNYMEGGGVGVKQNGVHTVKPQLRPYR